MSNLYIMNGLYLCTDKYLIFLTELLDKFCVFCLSVRKYGVVGIVLWACSSKRGEFRCFTGTVRVQVHRV